MLSREDCEKYEEYLANEVAQRKHHGAYSPDAPTILHLCRLGYELVLHIKETLPARPRKLKKRKRK